MKRIDRLIIKAKERDNLKTERLILAFITFDEIKDVYVADGRLWNGVKGSGTNIVKFECKTENEAFEVLHELGEEYPSNKPVIIIYNDLDLED